MKSGPEKPGRRDLFIQAGAIAALTTGAGIGAVMLDTAQEAWQKSSPDNKGLKEPDRIQSKEGESTATQIKFLDELSKDKGNFDKVLGGGRNALKVLLVERFGKDPDSVEALHDEKLYPARQISGWYQRTERLNKGNFTEITLKREINLQIVNLGNELISAKERALKKGQDKFQQ